MNRQDVVNNIMANYGRYGVDAALIEENIKSGEACGFSYDTIYTGLRLVLSSAYGTDEYFTVKEMAEALGESEEEIIRRIEDMREDIAAAGLNPDNYAHRIRPGESKKFIIMPDEL